MLTLHDSAKLIKENRNEAKKFAVWSKKGKTLIKPEEYSELSRAVSFDLTECPYDGFKSLDSKKGNRKAFDRTKSAIDHCFSEQDQQRQETILPVIGYEDHETRKFYLDHIISSQYKFKGKYPHTASK